MKIQLFKGMALGELDATAQGRDVFEVKCGAETSSKGFKNESQKRDSAQK